MGRLSGRTLVVTRARPRAEGLGSRLEELGARVIFCPTIRILPPEDPGRLQRARQEASSYDWVVFTSPEGVERFFQEGRVDLGRARVACIGPSTAEALPDRSADLLPERFVAEGLLEAFRAVPLAGARVLLPRASEAREVLPEQLRSRGAEVDVVPAYRTVPEDSLEPSLLTARVDGVSFTSSSTVKGFFQLLEGRRPAADFPALAIGPITAETCRELGFPLLGQAGRHTLEGLVELVLDCLGAPENEEAS